MSLSGMLMGIANDLGRPAQLSEGQRGLFNTLGASLAPMPAVNPDDPASLRSAAAEAMRRGDAQQARIYAVMASERENSVRQKNASQNALLDEGNAEIQAELARKQGMVANRTNAAAYERFLEPDLLQAVKGGHMPVAAAMQEQQKRSLAAQKELAANNRLLFQEQGRDRRAANGVGKTDGVNFQNVDVLQPDGTWKTQIARQVTSGPNSGAVVDINGQPITGEVRETMTGRTAEDIAADTPTSKDTQAILNQTKVEQSYGILEGMLQGSQGDQLWTLLQGSASIPTPVSRDWNQAVLEITNGVGRLESGAMIRKDEQADYRAMLIPTIFDVVNPTLMATKIRNGRAAARIYADVQTGKMTMAAGQAELRELLSKPVDPLGGKTVGTTPGGYKVIQR